jgi:hypothetical protein
MPNNSGIPSWKSVQFFENAIATHTSVESVTNRGENEFVINRKIHTPVVVYLTDVYTVGIADVIDAMTRIPDLSCVVTISNWNGYTQAAKDHGIQNHVGVFLFAELMGALNQDDIWTYVKHDKDGKPVYHCRG